MKKVSILYKLYTNLNVKNLLKYTNTYDIPIYKLFISCEGMFVLNF